MGFGRLRIVSGSRGVNPGRDLPPVLPAAAQLRVVVQRRKQETRAVNAEHSLLPKFASSRKARQGVHPVTPRSGPAILPIGANPTFPAGHYANYIDREVHTAKVLIDSPRRGIGVDCFRERQALRLAVDLCHAEHHNANRTLRSNYRRDENLTVICHCPTIGIPPCVPHARTADAGYCRTHRSERRLYPPALSGNRADRTHSRAFCLQVVFIPVFDV